MEDNKKMNTQSLMAIIYIMVVVIAGVSVAYAALSTPLNITTATVTQNPQTWAVGFNPGSVTAVSTGPTSSSRSCGTATVTAASVSVAATVLSEPGDTCTYALTVKNTGTIDATLATINPQNPSSVSCTNSGASMVCGHITYKLTTDSTGDTLLTTGGTLTKSTGTQTIYLVTTYSSDELATSEEVQTSGGFTLIYNQH